MSDQKERKTRADLIRSMTDEELAVWVAETSNCSDWCIVNDRCKAKGDGECCVNVWLAWLKEDADVAALEAWTA